MSLKLFMAVTIFATVPIVAFAQEDDLTNQAPKPTIADAQKLVQTISSDKTKLQAYREIGKLQDQMEKAEEKNDTKTIEALGAKVDNLEQQVGPDYARIMDGLSRPIRILLRDRSLPMYSILSTRNANRGVAPRVQLIFSGNLMPANRAIRTFRMMTCSAAHQTKRAPLSMSGTGRT